MCVPVSLEAGFALAHRTVQTVDALPAVLTRVVSAVRPQLAPEVTTRTREDGVAFSCGCIQCRGMRTTSFGKAECVSQRIPET